MPKFLQSQDGNVAVIFALVLVPIISFIGAAVDYSRASNARSAMQAAADSTALMISRDLASGRITTSQVSTAAQSYFNALFTNKDAGPVTLTTTYTPKDSKGASTVAVSGNTAMNTDFLRFAGYPTLPLGTSSTSTWGGTRMRVAMALDVTGSMASDGKMDAMQDAAKSLIDTLYTLSNSPDDVYVSIIPFAQMVNVGKSNKDAVWLDWTLWDEENGKCSSSYYDTKSACQGNGKTWTIEGHDKWEGCVTDRNQPYDTTSDAPTTTAKMFSPMKYEQSSFFEIVKKNLCPAQLLPMIALSNATNVKTVKDKIDELKPNGGTNQPIGMAWAWQALRAGDPLNTPAKDTNYKYTDILIILSDGMNTVDRWYGNGSSWSTQVDDRQRLLCDNIKNSVSGQAPTVFTIQVNTDGDPESAVLKYCADTAQFFPTSSAGGIASAFKQIGTSLSKLRVSK